MHVAIVTNMIAPYRVPLFSALAQHDGIGRLTVLTCVEKEVDRVWSVPADGGYELVRLWGLTLQQTLGSERLRIIHLRLGALTWILRHRPDRVVIGDASWTSYIAALACRLGRIPYWVWSEVTPSSKVSHGAAAGLRRWLYAGAAGFLAASTEAARFLQMQGVPPPRIRLAVNAVDVPRLQEARARWQPRAEAVRAELGVAPGAFVFLYVGQLISRKRVRETMQYLDAISSKHPVHLIVAGSGPLASALKAQAGACEGLAVSFEGFVEDDALWRLYAAADALILLSDDEPWGMVISEALAFGLPFFASEHVAAAKEFRQFGHVVNDQHIVTTELVTFLKQERGRAMMDSSPTPAQWANGIVLSIAKSPV